MPAREFRSNLLNVSPIALHALNVPEAGSANEVMDG